ncbi:MAG: hypothetical protein ACK4UN_16695 [Limisphaerales bacterium]
MAKAEISWKRVTEEGEKIQCYAHRFGGEYIFYQRSRRFDQWQRVDNPPLEDWLELLDSIQRRIVRRLLPPIEETRVKKMILDRYPGTKFDSPDQD